jgi:hypothetical protein
MKRLIFLLLTLLVTISLATSPAASADTLHVYRGRTSQTRPSHAMKVAFRVLQRVGMVRIKSVEIDFLLDCDDGSSTFWDAEHSWGLIGPQIQDGVVSIDRDLTPHSALHVRGTIRRRKGGEGTSTYNVALLDDDEQARLCTKTVRWDVHLSKVIRHWSPGD